MYVLAVMSVVTTQSFIIYMFKAVSVHTSSENKDKCKKTAFVDDCLVL